MATPNEAGHGGLGMTDLSGGIPTHPGHTYDWPDGSHDAALVDPDMDNESYFRQRDEPAPGPSKQSTVLGVHKEAAKRYGTSDCGLDMTDGGA